MKKLWAFVSTPANLAVLVAIGSGIAFLIREGLNVKTADDIREKPSVRQEAKANGGVAVNAAEGGEVNIGRASDDHPARSSSGSIPAEDQQDSATEQHAEATGGGTAINATESARVQVNGSSDQD